MDGRTDGRTDDSWIAYLQMIELINCLYKTKYSKYKSIKNMIKGLKIYVYILSMQDLIIKLFLKRSVLHLGTMKRLLHLKA